jgi:hypothetical protein
MQLKPRNKPTSYPLKPAYRKKHKTTAKKGKKMSTNPKQPAPFSAKSIAFPLNLTPLLMQYSSQAILYFFKALK